MKDAYGFMSKIVVLFPGIGYTCDKPLLYYGRKVANEAGYEVCRKVAYSYDGGNIRGNHQKMQEAFEALYAQTQISVIIPAHNEEKYIARCIRSVRRAAAEFPGNVEIIVVCNRCTDRTAVIAKKHGARVLVNEDRCIAKVRNTGIFAANGEIIVTIDADNRMTKGTLREVYSLLKSGKYIGGGAPIRFERYSFPLWCNDILCRVSFGITGLYSGIFWAEKATFEAIGGFVDKKAMEDVATAKLLKEYGKRNGKKYTSLHHNVLINSTRKYDEMGDWLYFKIMVQNAGTLVRAAFGDTAGLDRLLDELFYDYNG